eukprot:Em0008g931a
MWLGGNLSELWSFAQNRAASSSHSNKTTRVRPNDGVTSAISLSKDGLYGKACWLLVSQGVAPNNESTWNLLVSKHPKGGCPVGLPGAPNDGTLPPDFNLGPVLRSFPKLTGAGPSGLRIQHLLDAVEVPLQTLILHSLKAVVNILSSGRAPALISPFLAGGNLTALVKSKDSCASDIRPIAVGETLCRLTAKCLCAVVKAKAAEFFQPHKFGVSCSMGAEKIAHGLRACVDRQWKDEGFSVLKLDMRNAFNVVSRQAFLSECSLHFPELYPWVLWCYGQHPILWHPMGTLTSECGVQQGDPLGPLLFCLVLNILVKDICSDPNCANLSFHSWYLDDGVVAGPSLAVQKVLALIEEKGPPLGLLVNFSKCEVFSPTDVNLFREFCSNYISNKCASAKLLLHKLEEVGAQDAQVALVLLRLCGSFLESFAQRPPIQKALSAKIDDFQFNQLFNSSSLADRARLLFISSPHASSWLSVVPSKGLGLHLNPDQFQVAIKWWLGLDTSGGSLCSLCPDTVLDPLGHHASTCKRGGDAVFRHNRLRDVVAESCRLAHLSVKVEAGNNLTPDHSHTRPADVLVQNWSRGRPAAFDICVTSPLNTLTLSEAGVCAVPHSSAAFISSLCSSGFGLQSSHHLSQAIETFNSLVSPADAVSVESLLTSSVSQKYLSGKLDDRVFNMLLNSSSVADKARLLSVSSPHAASWLSVVPSENLGLHLDPPVFQVAIKWWLGLDTSEGSQCALCPGSTLDHLDHHAVTCKYGGDVVSRHNRIRDILVETCRRAHIGVKVEVGNNLSRDHSKTHPADILLPNWFLGRTAALDVSITSLLNPVTLLEAGVSATAAAQATEARKHQANDPKCSELGWVCVLMVVETYGAWGKEATVIISSVASRLVTSTCWPKSTIVHEIYGRLNLNLVCANATAILSRIAPPP